MTNKEKEKITKRLEWLDKEIVYRKKQLGDPFHHHHYAGYLEAADGMLGERQFLMKLLKADKEKEAE